MHCEVFSWTQVSAQTLECSEISGKIPFVDLAFQQSACQLWIKLEFLVRYFFRQNNFSSLLFTAWCSSVIALDLIAVVSEHPSSELCRSTAAELEAQKTSVWLNKSHGVFQGNTAWKLCSSKPALFCLLIHRFFSRAKGALNHHYLYFLCAEAWNNQLAWCGAQSLPWPQLICSLEVSVALGSGALCTLLALLWSFAEVQLSFQNLVTAQC